MHKVYGGLTARPAESEHPGTELNCSLQPAKKIKKKSPIRDRTLLLIEVREERRT
jgi:hypothetical protein